MRIGIDIDGVLTDLYYFNQFYGQLFCLEQNWPTSFFENGYKVRDMYHWTRTQERKFYQKYYLLYLKSSDFIRPFAVQTIHDLHKYHEIIIITARKNEDIPLIEKKSMEDITEDWLQQNNFEYDSLKFGQDDKTDIILQNDIQLMVEDSPDFFSTIDISIPILCFNEKYNQNVSGRNIYRVYNWMQIESKVCEINNNLLRGYTYE